jgi:hypothetical protein
MKPGSLSRQSSSGLLRSFGTRAPRSLLPGLRRAWFIARGIVPYSAPLLLVLVALIGVYRARLYGQSPWKGGGFGMFASLDVRNSYHLRNYLIIETRVERVSTPASLKKEETLARTVPTRENLYLFARSLAQETWVPSGYRERIFGGRPALKQGASFVNSARPVGLLGAPFGQGPILAASAFVANRVTKEPGQTQLHPRALQHMEPKPSDNERVVFKGTNVVLQKETFDAKTGRVELVELFRVSHMRQQ